MSDQKQGFDNKNNAPKSKQGAEETSSAWKRLLAKRWVFPAVYVLAAAIIVTIVWGAYNNATKSANPASSSTTQTDVIGDTPVNGTLTVNGKVETMKWPVKEKDAMEVVLPYYDVNASIEDRELATIQYGDTFIPSQGLGIARKDKETFDVLAALTGKVTRVEKDPIVGNLVEVTHANGLVTVYQSLQNVEVTKDVEVKQGDLLGTAGRNDLEKEHGVHLHFEIRQTGGSTLNPEQYLGINTKVDTKDTAKTEVPSKQEAKKNDATKQDSNNDTTKSNDKGVSGEQKPEDNNSVKTPEANKDKAPGTEKGNE